MKSAATLLSECRRRIPASIEALQRFWRPQAPPDIPAGVAAGIALLTPLLAMYWAGHADIGASMSLAALLVVMPLGTTDRAERARLLATRTVSLTAAGVVVWLIGPHTWLLVIAVTAAAALGAFLPRVGVTAALGVLLIGITGSGAATVVPGLDQLLGSLWAALLIFPNWGHRKSTPPAQAMSPRARLSSPKIRHHAARLALLTAVVSSTLLSGGLLGGGAHWLVTSLLLTLQPTSEQTRAKGLQRTVGNSLGGVVTALILITNPGTITVAIGVGLAAVFGYGWRPANYLYWSLAAPALLLLLADYSTPMPWYDGALRAALNALGALIAYHSTRWLWPEPATPS
ncbi:FUSC family protein [Nocardia sp. NPDC058058]|uniref:FUSC family protein n=1 Tax=Nocardia sp. NPDC058058 TaxID=3346317 RepID=UPI0036DEE523